MLLNESVLKHVTVLLSQFNEQKQFVQMSCCLRTGVIPCENNLIKQHTQRLINILHIPEGSWTIRNQLITRVIQKHSWNQLGENFPKIAHLIKLHRVLNFN